MLTLGFTVLLAFVTGDAMTSIPIAVFAPSDVSDVLVDRICSEAADIWKSAGIVLEWHRVGSETGVGEWPLAITIDDRHTSVESHGALGWITFTANRPNRSIHLSRASAEDLVRTTPDLNDVTVFSHEILIGRALGRALAHELGHFLLRSKAHTSSGLMRSNWSSDDAFASARKSFELTAEQGATALGYFAWNERVPTADGSNHVNQAGVGHSQLGDFR